MPKDKIIRSLLPYVAVLLLSVAIGAAAARHHRRAGPGAVLKQWERMDFVRDAAVWGFQFAALVDAERLVAGQVESLKSCVNEVPTYPCEGKLQIEAFLMMAALRDEAGDAHGRDSWLVKAASACGKNATASCNEVALKRAMVQRASCRHSGTAGQ
jgi:hypothetical protein